MPPQTLVTGGDPESPVFAPSRIAFEGADFLSAPEVQRIGEALIATKPEFEHLEKWRIRYVWKREAGRKAGKTVLGDCAKAAGLVRFFGECDFVVAVGADVAVLINGWQLEALVYHQLSHAGETEVEDLDTGEVTYVPRIIGHDAELFCAEVTAYGAWNRELIDVGVAYGQASLLNLEPTPIRRQAS